MQKFRLGKLPAQRRLGVPALGDFLDKAAVWPSVPPQGWEAVVGSGDWGMLGNDTVGDCAIAGIMHLVQAQSANVGAELHSTSDQSLALYSAVTGYNPANPNSDQGTVLADLLAYVQKNGLEMFDANGAVTTVDIVGYAAVDITSLAQLRYATYIFGGTYLGINCPEECENDLTNWNFGPNLPLAGGHCIARVGEGAAGGKIVSWGTVIPFSNNFWFNYGDEAWVVLTKAWVNAQAESPSGMDLDGLISAMQQFKGATI